jgi:hypothetical protein
LHFVESGGDLDFEIRRTGFMTWVEENQKLYNFLNRISVLSYFRDKYLQDINAWVKNFGERKIAAHDKKPAASIEVSSLAEDPMLEKRMMIDKQLQKLKKTYGDKFALLYLPRNPVMKNKNLFVQEPMEKKFNQLIGELSTKANVPIISMWQPFLDLYLEHHLLSSGFDNTVPGEGHINKEGHRLIAEQLILFLNGRLKK